MTREEYKRREEEPRAGVNLCIIPGVRKTPFPAQCLSYCAQLSHRGLHTHRPYAE